MVDKVLGSVPVAPAESSAGLAKPFQKVLKAATQTPRAAAAQAGSRPAAAKFVGEIAEAQRRLDKILKLAESGRTFSPAELLAMQAHAYRASQEIDLASKVVEKGTAAVKQTLQTQI